MSAEEKKDKKTDVRTATLIARQYFKDITGYEDDDITIEEVELTDTNEGLFWFITLGYWEKTHPEIYLPIIPKIQKSYKIFKIGVVDGKVHSMKVGKLGEEKK